MGDTSDIGGNSARRRGKMYWKFATLRGWQANQDQNPTPDLRESPKKDRRTISEKENPPDEPGRSDR